jgi:hypothetical protein
MLPVGCDIDRAMMVAALICLLPRDIRPDIGFAVDKYPWEDRLGKAWQA